MARKKLSPVQATRKSVRSLPPEKFSKAIEEAPIFGRGSYRSSVWPLSLVLCLCVCTLNQTQPLVCCMTASMLPVHYLCVIVPSDSPQFENTRSARFGLRSL